MNLIPYNDLIVGFSVGFLCCWFLWMWSFILNKGKNNANTGNQVEEINERVKGFEEKEMELADDLNNEISKISRTAEGVKT